MQILKPLSFFCAAVLSVCVVSAQNDSDAQNKAREALRQKMEDLQRNPPPDSAPAPVAPAPKPAPAPRSKKAAQPAPVTKAPAPVESTAPRWTPSPSTRQAPVAEPKSTPAPAPVVEQKPEPVPEPVVQSKPDSEAIAKAREAMREKMNALEAQQPAPAPVQPAPPAQVSTPAPKPKQAPAPAPVVRSEKKPAPAPVVRSEKKPAPAPVVRAEKKPTPTPPKAEPAPASQPAPSVVATRAPKFSSEEPNATPAKVDPGVRQELDKKEAELAATRTAQRPSMPAPEKNQPRRKSQAQPRNEVPSYQPLEAPALPISDAKHQQLQELLRRYQADELTPSQYHLERAKILAQP